LPVFKCEITLDGSIDIETVANILSNVESYGAWNSTIRNVQIIKDYSKNVKLYQYEFYDKGLFYQDREFLNKSIAFIDNSINNEDMYYIYQTAIPNEWSTILDPLFIRGNMIFTSYRISKDNIGNLKIIYCSQVDFKVLPEEFLVYKKHAENVEEFVQEFLAQLNTIPLDKKPIRFLQ